MRATTALAAAAVVALPLLAVCAQVQAQATRGPGSYADPYWGRQGNLICRRWCLDDRTPCDPFQYKAADGRCNGETRTFFGVLQCRIGPGNSIICP
jgi:hypothetical protein